MKQIIAGAIGAFFMFTYPAIAEDEVAVFAPLPAAEHDLADFKWESRVIAIFADSELDPNYQEQITLLEERFEELLERDVVVLTDTVPNAPSEIREELRPRGFAIVMLDKNGRVILRKPRPWDVRELTHAIDKTPLRQQELRQ